MRNPASEKLEIIGIVEQSHLPAKRTLDQLGIARRTFYRWYDHYLDDSSLKTERTARKVYRTKDDAKADVFDYIERYYNPKRRHSTIGYMNPVEFKMRAGLA